MKILVGFILLGISNVGCPMQTFAQAQGNAWSQSRASRKAEKQQQKAAKKYAKAQRKAQNKMLKTESKNTHYPPQVF